MTSVQPARKDWRAVVPWHLLDEDVAKRLYALLAGETILCDSLPAGVLSCPEAGQGISTSPAPPGLHPAAPGVFRTL